LITAGQKTDNEGLQPLLEAAADISLEPERALCRVAEFVYFGLEMQYQKVGIAFCINLFEQAGVLARVLDRFFEVSSVCCRIGKVHSAATADNPDSSMADLEFDNVPCNPVGQAEILNHLGTDINIIAGLCMGMDCVFTEVSQAPVTTLFVKDKMLANNPIGAVYSDFYLDEIARQGLGEDR
jgi:uncharacterized metal-binding protein